MKWDYRRTQYLRYVGKGKSKSPEFVYLTQVCKKTVLQIFQLLPTRKRKTIRNSCPHSDQSTEKGKVYHKKKISQLTANKELQVKEKLLGYRTGATWLASLPAFLSSLPLINLRDYALIFWRKIRMTRKMKKIKQNS